MDALKGQARTILTSQTPLAWLSLVSYVDQSWGILRDGLVFCIWEPSEMDDCLRTFAHLWARGRDDHTAGMKKCVGDHLSTVAS